MKTVYDFIIFLIHRFSLCYKRVLQNLPVLTYVIREATERYLCSEIGPSGQEPLPARDGWLHHRLVKESNWRDAEVLQQATIGVLWSDQQRRHTKQHALELRHVWKKKHSKKLLTPRVKKSEVSRIKRSTWHTIDRFKHDFLQAI